MSSALLTERELAPALPSCLPESGPLAFAPGSQVTMTGPGEERAVVPVEVVSALQGAGWKVESFVERRSAREEQQLRFEVALAKRGVPSPGRRPVRQTRARERRAARRRAAAQPGPTDSEPAEPRRPLPRPPRKIDGHGRDMWGGWA